MSSSLKREFNYDLLRIAATIAVVAIHVSALLLKGYASIGPMEGVNTDLSVLTSFFNCISRFAVPSFVMITGAFCISNNKNSDARAFYLKSFKRVGIPTIVFSILYFLFFEGMKLIKFAGDGDSSELLKPVTELICGRPFYHMWYLFMLPWMYFFVPLLIKYKAKVGEKTFAIYSWIYLVLLSLLAWSMPYYVEWGIRHAIGFLGYLLAGYQIYRMFKGKENNIRGLIFILLSVIPAGIVAYFQNQYEMQGFYKTRETTLITDSFCPLIVIMSLLIFMGFASFKVTKDRKIYKIVPYMFYVYLFHAGIWDVVSRLMPKIWGLTNVIPPVFIVVCTCVLFVVSLGVSVIWLKLWNFVVSKMNRKGAAV